AIMEVIKAIRNMRAEVNAAPGKKSEAILHVADGAQQALFVANDGYLHALAEADPVTILPTGAEKPTNAMTAVAGGVEIYLPLKGLIDVEKETARLAKERDGLVNEIARTEGKLANEKFVAKAPAEVVAKEREKLSAAKEKKRVVEERLRYLATL
ncbi:MAG: valine--tRNA ligase, partial [Schwartzia sp. (in: firmicutes)]